MTVIWRRWCSACRSVAGFDLVTISGRAEDERGETAPRITARSADHPAAGLSETTLFQKIGARDRTQAALFAFSTELVSRPMDLAG